MTEDTMSGEPEPLVSGADIRTFLFADMRGYTRYTQEHGDDAASALAGRFADLVKATVPAFEGELLELRGDEALCVFRSVRQALRAAVGLQRRLRTGTDEEPAFPIGVGVGLDAGEAVPTHGGYRGASLNLAARLCSLAKPGEILASETVTGLASHVDGMRFLEGHSAPLKGMARPVRYVVVQPETPLPPVPAAVRAGRTRVSSRVLVLVGGVVLLAVAALAAGTLRGGSTSPALAANAVGALDQSGTVSSQVVIPAGGRPGGIAVGGGGVWVTDAVNGSLLEINPSSGAIVETVNNAGVVPAGVAVGGGGVWVADSGGATVRWFNAAAPGRTSRVIRVGQGPGPIAYGLGAAWVVNTVDGTLQRISSSNFKTSLPISIGVSPSAVAVGGGSAWVTDSASNSVMRVSPAGQVIDHIGVGNDPSAIAFGDGDVWVANAADGTLTRIDPQTDAQRVIAVGGQPTGVTLAAGSVWATIAQPDRVARIDPGTLNLTEMNLASPPQAITPFGDRLWVTSLASPVSHRGGTLRVLFGATNTGSPFASGYHPFDPGAAPYGSHFALLRLTNDGLVALRPAGGAAGNQLVPDLAVAMPVISDGGRTYTFRIRRGIHYSNGQPVRPSDFRFAVERQFLNPVSYGTSFFTDISGSADPDCQKLTGPQNPAAHQESVQRCRAALDAGIVPNDKAGTVTIHIQRPDGGFVYQLASTFADLLPENGTPAIDSGKPVPASGPYVINQAGAERITLVRNPRFHVSSAAQPAGFADSITFAYQPDPVRALTEIEHGRADVMLDPPPAKKSTELRTRYATLIHPYAALETNYMAFNTRVAPFSDVRARQAVNFAIDRRRFARLAGGTQDNAPPTCQVLPPTMFGYHAYCPYTTHPNPTTGAWHAPNLARAHALVRASGTAGDTVDLRTLAGLVSRADSRYIAGVLTNLGYNVITHTFPNTSAGNGAYVQATSNPRLPLAIIEGWIADYPYPSDFFVPLLVCGAGPEGGIKFCDPHLDTLVRTGEATDGAAAIQAWEAADREAVNQAAWAPLINRTGIDVVSRRVGNYQRNPLYGEILNQMWVR